MSDISIDLAEPSQRLLRLHRLNAFILIAFLVLHLTTHALAILGPSTHAQFLNVIRQIYRASIIEPLLIGLFVSQVVLGALLFLRRYPKKKKSLWSWIQLLSGGYLVVFLLNHIFLGVLMGRSYDGLDTGFHFVAATVMVEPLAWFFRPYYVLAVTAICAHLAAALHFRNASSKLCWFLVTFGFGLGIVSVAAYAGLLFEIDLPQLYKDYVKNIF